MKRNLLLLVKWTKHSARQALKGRAPDFQALRRTLRVRPLPRETKEERATRRKREREALRLARKSPPSAGPQEEPSRTDTKASDPRPRAETPKEERAARRHVQRAESRQVHRTLPASVADRLINSLLATGTPIIAGPWLGEVGFEVLYWIPFLRWVVDHGVSPDRILAVSRGGPRSWYRGVARDYRDIFDMMTPEEFRERNRERTGQDSRQKQRPRLSSFEDELIERAAAEAGLDGYTALRPGTVYQAIRRYSLGHEPLEVITPLLRHVPIDPLPDASLNWLPDRFIAAKFYWSPRLKPSRSDRRSIANLIEALQEIAPVVLLDTGVRADDHPELTGSQAERVISIAPHLTPATNLEVQTQVLARALAYVGTYGGTSYLASACGIPTFTLTTTPHKLPAAHVALGAHVGTLPGHGPISIYDVRELSELERIPEQLRGQLAHST